ncbi:unnamed protein product, partial [Brachionus calyciflorus]
FNSSFSLPSISVSQSTTSQIPLNATGIITDTISNSQIQSQELENIPNSQTQPNQIPTTQNINVPMDFNQFLNLFQTQFETPVTKINQRLDAMDKSMSISVDDKFKSITKLIVNNDSTKIYWSKLKEFTLNRIRYEMHIKLLNNYIEAKKTPPSLMHNRFPKPMFRDSQSFLDNYNKEVELFQVRLMNTTIDELKLKVINCNKEIGILKELLSNVVDDIDKSMSDLDSKCRDELKDNESKQNEVFMRLEPSPFSVVKNFNQKSSNNYFLGLNKFVDSTGNPEGSTGNQVNTQVQQNTDESNNLSNENQSVKNKTTHNYKKKRGLNQRRSHNKLKKQRSNTNNNKLKRHDNFRRSVNTNSTKRFNSNQIQQINNAANNNSIVKSNVQTIRNRQGYQPVQNTSFNNYRPPMYKTQNNQIKQFISQRQQQQQHNVQQQFRLPNHNHQNQSNFQYRPRFRSQTQSLSFFIKHKPFVVLESDKNVGACLITQPLCNSLALDCLSDTSIYIKLDSDPLNDIKTRIESQLNSLVDLGWISKRLKKLLIVDNPKLSKFRILPKIHKKNFSVRPIVNCISSPTSKLCLLVYILLQPIVEKCYSYLKDSQHLLQVFDDVDFHQYLNKIKMYSCDFNSLYSNIELDLALNILLETVVEEGILDEQYLIILGFEVILKLIFENNCFSYLEYYFRQKKGIAMGAICGPTIANIVVSKVERKWIIIHRPLVYKRFIDDIFIILLTELDKTDFQNQFENLKINISEGQRVVFLDLVLHFDELFNKLRISLHIKETHNFGYLLTNSNHPQAIFKNIPVSLFIRIRRICTELQDFLFYSRQLFTHLLS